MAIEAIKKRYPIVDENGQPSTYPTFASQVFFNDGTVLEGKEFDGASIDPLTIYPIGSIYMTMNDAETDRPAYLFGGTWERIKGRFLLGTGKPENNDDETSPGDYEYAAGDKYGKEKHTLTVNEMPKHYHSSYVNYLGSGTEHTIPAYYAQFQDGSYKYHYSAESGKSLMAITEQKGGSLPHNNMPPFEAVNIWKRVA